MAPFDCHHIQRVRILYKAILRLHRGLEPELRALGDQYVKDEFRRHKKAESQFVPVFMSEWTNYAITLANQLGKHATNRVLGLKLSEGTLNTLRGDQVGQLYQLFLETQKPVNPTNTLGENPSQVTPNSP